MTVERNPDVVFRGLADGRGGVLLDTKSTAYHSLNELGALIWQMLERPIHLGELISHLGDVFEEPPSSLREDVTTYLAELASRHLVRLTGPRPPE